MYRKWLAFSFVSCVSSTLQPFLLKGEFGKDSLKMTTSQSDQAKPIMGNLLKRIAVIVLGLGISQYKALLFNAAHLLIWVSFPLLPLCELVCAWVRDLFQSAEMRTESSLVVSLLFQWKFLSTFS